MFYFISWAPGPGVGGTYYYYAGLS